LSRGVWQRGLRGGRWRQYLLAALLGATPGCLGAFAVVSLYLHKEVSLGALLPLLAESRRDFFQVKAINFVVGLLTGLVGSFFGW